MITVPYYRSKKQLTSGVRPMTHLPEIFFQAHYATTN